MPYIGNVTTSSNVNGSQINNGTITGDKLSLPFDYDSATLYLDNTNNRVGILTASPSSTLTVGTGGVVSIPLASAATPSLVFGTDTNTGIYSPGADQLAISTNGTGRLFVSSAGLVGVGTSSPSVALHVSASGNTPIISQTTAGATSYLSLQNTGGMGYIASSTNDVIIATSSNADERVRVTSTGLVGIGTSSPNVPLQVIGGSTVTDPVIRATNSGATQSMALTSAGLRMDGAAPIQINQGGSEVVRIDTSGRLLVGTSSSYGVQATIAGAAGAVSTGAGSYAVLSLADTNAVATGVGGGIAFQGNDGVNGLVTFSQIQGFKENSTSGNYAGGLSFSVRQNAANVTERMRIDSSGRVGIGTTATTAGCKLNVDTGINCNGLNVSGNGGFFNAANKVGIDNNGGISRFYSSGANSSTRGSYDFRITDSAGTLDTSVVVIDNSGRLLVGTSSTSANLRALIQATSANGAGGGNLYLARGESTPADGASLGYLGFSDSNHASAAGLEAVRDGGTWTSGSSQPSRLVFSVTSDGSASPSEALRISNDRSIGITQAPGKYSISTSEGATSIANNGIVDFAYFSGFVLVTNYSNGAVQCWLAGAGGTTSINTVGGTAGSLAYNAGVNTYRWTNNSGSAATFGFFCIRTRSAA